MALQDQQVETRTAESAESKTVVLMAVLGIGAVFGLLVTIGNSIGDLDHQINKQKTATPINSGMPTAPKNKMVSSWSMGGSVPS